MNCDLASHLIDDYLENQLSQRDRHFLEEHLSRCFSCAQELYQRPALERDVRKALTASVVPLHLSPGASRRIIQASQDSLLRATRLNGFLLAARATAGALAAFLLVIGLLFLLGRVLGLTQFEALTQLPAIRLPLSELFPANLPARDQAASADTSAFLESWTDGELLVEPLNLHAGEPFTMTVFLNSDMPQPLEDVHLNLDIGGPSGYYHFVLAVKGPLPAHGLSVLRVTPDLLSAPCQEQYLISPADIFKLPGSYAVRVTLSARLPSQSDNPD